MNNSNLYLFTIQYSKFLVLLQKFYWKSPPRLWLDCKKNFVRWKTCFEEGTRPVPNLFRYKTRTKIIKASQINCLLIDICDLNSWNLIKFAKMIGGNLQLSDVLHQVTQPYWSEAVATSLLGERERSLNKSTLWRHQTGVTSYISYYATLQQQHCNLLQ